MADSHLFGRSRTFVDVLYDRVHGDIKCFQIVISESLQWFFKFWKQVVVGRTLNWPIWRVFKNSPVVLLEHVPNNARLVRHDVIMYN